MCFFTDIIICNDEAGSPKPVSDIFSKSEFGKIHKLPDTVNKWIVLVVAPRNAIITGRNVPTGPYHKKILELRKLGYYPTLVTNKNIDITCSLSH